MSTRQFSTVGSGPVPVACIPGRRALAFCTWALFAALSAQAYGECPSEAGLCKLVTLAEDSLSVHELWAMGADVWSVEDGRIFVRVSDEILATLTARDLPYEMVYEDVYAALRERRRTRAVKRSESFLEYHDLDATVAAMQRIVDEHPDIAAMEVIGRSLENQPIHALRISDNADTVEPEEPGMLVVGCHHAREWISVEVPLYIADYLTDQYLLEGDVTRLVNYTEVWIVPVLNPDGFLHSWTDDRLWRKNRRENGDGTNGVDLNRNYSIGFGGDEGSSSYTLFETYRGPFPFSEPETQTIRDLIGGSFGRTFDSALSYHNFSQLVLYPNGYTAQPTANAAYYRELTREMARLINEPHFDPQFDYVSQPSAFLLPVERSIYGLGSPRGGRNSDPYRIAAGRMARFLRTAGGPNQTHLSREPSRVLVHGRADDDPEHEITRRRS
jgi:carboxypeptidase T